MVTVLPQPNTISNGQAGNATPVNDNFIAAFANDAALLAAILALQTSSSGAGVFPGFDITADPVYLTGNTFSVKSISCTDSTNTLIISKSTSTTVNTNTIGLNGIAQSPNLTGTISVSNGAATVTGTGTAFTTDFQVGDVLTTAGGQLRKVASITNNLNLTVTENFTSTENTVTYKRGGLVKTTFYYLYAVVKADGTLPGLLLSTRNVAGGDTLVDLPSAYTASRQLKFSPRIDGGLNLNPFIANGREILYRDFNITAYEIITGLTAIDWTTVNLALLVPKTSRMGIISTRSFNNTGPGFTYVRPSPTSGGEITLSEITIANQVETLQRLAIATNSSQQIAAKVTLGAALTLGVAGFIVTEV